VICFYLGGSPCYSVCGQALAPQQGHPRHWDRIDACTRAQEEAQDGMYRRPWRVKDETLTLKGSREEQSRADTTLICAFVYVFHLYFDVIYLGTVPVTLCATVYLCCAKLLRVPCLRIQRGCKCEKVS